MGLKAIGPFSNLELQMPTSDYFWSLVGIFALRPRDHRVSHKCVQSVFAAFSGKTGDRTPVRKLCPNSGAIRKELHDGVNNE